MVALVEAESHACQLDCAVAKATDVEEGAKRALTVDRRCGMYDVVPCEVEVLAREAGVVGHLAVKGRRDNRRMPEAEIVDT